LTDHQKKIDIAQYLKLVVDTFYPHISLIRLVTDNLNTHTHTHTPTALYETFPPEKAHRFCQRFEWRYTPKHASWLNCAEIEFSALQKQCLRERCFASKDELSQEIKSWEHDRNQQHVQIEWRFSTTEARKKMKRYYPAK
jgi:hypothetical protein